MSKSERLHQEIREWKADPISRILLSRLLEERESIQGGMVRSNLRLDPLLDREFNYRMGQLSILELILSEDFLDDETGSI